MQDDENELNRSMRKELRRGTRKYETKGQNES